MSGAEGPRRLAIHPLETALLWVVAAHLVFLPWALGGVRMWAIIPSLVIAAISFVLALWPRNYTAAHTGGPSFRALPFPKLTKFPIFWLGLALLALVLTQALNPAWEYVTNGKVWWMQRIPYIEWLPHGVRVPLVQAPGLAEGNPWRSLMVFGSAWMTVCAIWGGFTRRRTLQRLLLVLIIDGLVLALLGFAERFAHLPFFALFSTPPGAALFSSFIYKNHAGAYFDVIIGVTCAVGAWYYFRGVRRLEKSSPGGVFAFIATILAVAVIISYARGATLTMMTYLFIAAAGFVIHQLFLAPKVTRKPVVVLVLVLVFGVFLKTGLQAVNTGEAWDKIEAGFANGGDFSLRTRIAVTEASVDMLKDHWGLGIGSGSFPYVFPLYQRYQPELQYFPGTTRPQFWPHAHNDWVEFPNELGVPGMLIILLSFGWYGLILVRNYFWGNPFSIVLVLGLVAVLFYSYWDFPFECPAILITWCALWPVCARWTMLEEQRSRP